MGCGGSSEQASQPQQQQQQQASQPPQMGGGGGPARGPVIGQPNANDPPFMQTASPCGMSWGQYCKGAKSFVDPQTGLLGGSWAECVAWGVVFEHSNDWGKMPQYAADGPVGGIMMALEAACGGRQDIMEAANRLEEKSHTLADTGQPLPAIQQAVKLPPNAVAGQQCTVGHPSMPGAYQKITVPPGGKPGQTIMTPAPVQPTQNGKTGMSTGSKVAFAAGGVVAVGAAAGVAYYATQGGGFDGFTGDVGAAGEWAGGAAGSAGDWVQGDGADWAAGAAGDAGDWTTAAAGDVGGWAEGTAAPWAEGAAGDVGEWTTGACGDATDEGLNFLMDLF